MNDRRKTPTDDGRFASEYTESRRPINFDDIRVSRFSGLTTSESTGSQDAFEFDYTTSHGNRKTVRCLNGISSSDRDVDKGAPAEAVTFHDGSTGYAVDLETRELYKYGDDHTYRKIADTVDAYHVELGESAPVVGAIQEGVDVTVHYRSNRSGNMKTITLEDVRVDWEGDRVTGYHSRRDRRVEVEAIYERSVTTKSVRGGDREVGKVARIEFPSGHRFTVDIHGMTDDETGDYKGDTRKTTTEAIEEAIASKFSDHEVDVTHDGRIDD